jgi:hypothetical protein
LNQPQKQETKALEKTGKDQTRRQKLKKKNNKSLTQLLVKNIYLVKEIGNEEKK